MVQGSSRFGDVARRVGGGGSRTNEVLQKSELVKFIFCDTSLPLPFHTAFALTAPQSFTPYPGYENGSTTWIKSTAALQLQLSS